MPNRRMLAAVDLGSNSFSMLVVRVDGHRIEIIDRLKEPVRLRWGLLADGTLTREAQERALDCLRRFAQRLRGLKPENIRIVGTNTMRRARNTKPFLQKIEEIMRVPVEVINGREEARLIYLGVATYLPPTEDRVLVVDIGGGSTEFVIGKGLEITERETRPIGCVAASMAYFSEESFTKKRFNKALLWVKQELQVYHQTFAPKKWDRAIGSSGTIKAVARILHPMGYPRITMAGMQKLRDQLFDAKRLRDLNLDGLSDDRRPVIFGGFTVLYGIFDVFGIKEMEISLNSLREGLILDTLGRSENRDIREATVARLQRVYNVDVDQAIRVKKTALTLFQQIIGQLFSRRHTARKMLAWAADLHEIGLPIAHSGYHKHGAYILLNGDLDGFSQAEQTLLGFLVLNHRKRLKTDPMPYEEDEAWPLVFLLRIAYILCRDRLAYELPDMALTWEQGRIDFKIDRGWLAHRPLTISDLENEQTYWQKIGFTMSLNGQAID